MGKKKILVIGVIFISALFSALIYFFKPTERLESLIFDILRREMAKACSVCEVRYQRMEVNYSALRLNVFGLHLTRNGIVETRVEEMEAVFSLRQIFSRILHLDYLALKDGFVIENSQERTALYLLLDQLTQSSDKPPPIKLSVNHIEIKSKLVANLSESQVVVGLKFVVDKDHRRDHFKYLLDINNLYYNRGSLSILALSKGLARGLMGVRPGNLITVDFFRGQLGESNFKLLDPLEMDVKLKILKPARLAGVMQAQHLLQSDNYLGKLSFNGVLTNYLDKPNFAGQGVVFGFDAVDRLSKHRRDKGFYERPRCLLPYLTYSATHELKALKPINFCELEEIKTEFVLNHDGDNFMAKFSLRGASDFFQSAYLEGEYPDPKGNILVDLKFPKQEVAVNPLAIFGVDLERGALRVEPKEKKVEIHGQEISYDFKNIFFGTGKIKLAMPTDLSSFSISGDLQRQNRFGEKGTVNFSWKTGRRVKLTAKAYPILIAGSEYVVSGELANDQVRGDVILPDFYKYFGLKANGHTDIYLTIKNFNLEDFQILYRFVDSDSFKGTARVENLRTIKAQAKVAEHLFLPCFKASLSAEYELNLVDFAKSAGSLDDVIIDNECGNRHSFTLGKPIGIKEDVINLIRHNFVSRAGNFELNGNLSGNGADLRVIIDTRVRDVMYFPNMSFGGRAHGALSINGPYTALKYRGQVTIRRGSVRGDNFEIDRIAGDILLEDDRLIPRNFSFNYLGNRVKVGGFYDIYNQQQSAFELNSNFEIDQDGWQVLGDTFLKISFVANKVIVGGEVELTDLVYGKEIGLKQILSDLISNYFDFKRPVSKQSSASDLVEMDLKLSLPKTKFVSYFAKGLLEGAINIRGALDNLQAQGAVKVDQMIFGLKNIRFVGKEGLILFRGALLKPKIDFIGESQVVSAKGRNTSILVTVDGTPTEPRIRFTSDRGLSESEIVELLAFNNSDTGSESVLGLDYEVKLSESRWINFLTSIDSVSIEPFFNPFTSTFEPRILARKKIFDELNLYASRVFSNTFASSDISLVFGLTDRVNLIQSLRLLPGQNSLTPESDMEIWIMGKREEARIVFAGNAYFSDFDLRELLILPKDLNEKVLRDIEERLKSHYQANGFFDAIILATLNEDKIEVLINEQEQQRLTVEKYPEFSGIVASAANLAELQRYVRRRCIENYPNCKVRVSYRKGKLRIRKRLNKQTSYALFPADIHQKKRLRRVVLRTIEDLGRFSPEGIKASIEAYYFERNYLDANVSYESNAGHYRFSIDTGKKAEYARVTIDNLCDQRPVFVKKLRRVAYFLRQLNVAFPQSSISYNTNDGTLSFRVTCPMQVKEVLLPEDLSVYEAGKDLPKTFRDVQPYLDNLLLAIKDDGYPNARLNSSITDGVVKVRAFLGNPELIVRIDAPEELREHLKFKEGDRFSSRLVSESIDSIYRTQGYQDVEVEKLYEATELVVKVSAKKRDNRLLKLGIGINSGYGVHLFSEAGHGRMSFRNDFYVATDLGEITFGSGNLVRSYDIGMEDVEFVQDLGFQKLKNFNMPYDVTRFGLVNYLAKGNYSSFGHSLVFDDIDSETNSILSELDEGSLRISKLQFKVMLDKRDASLLPNNGYTVQLNLTGSSQEIGSDANFYGGDLAYTQIVPLDNFNINFLGRAGYLHPFGDTDYVPITERYLLGGRNSVRGFRENQLGQRREGSVLGGEWLTQTSLQFGYRYTQSNEFYTFLDSGNVGVDKFTLSQRFSFGLGYQYLSLVGPMGIALGMPLGERSGEPSMRLHFSIGSKY